MLRCERTGHLYSGDDLQGEDSFVWEDTGKPHDSSNRRGIGSGIGGVAGPKQGSISGSLYLSWPLWGLHGFEQLPSPCVAQTGRGTGTAEADVPSRSEEHTSELQSL